MHVIGTAGHVDHGKSALVLTLTGINPDRLQEEKDRQMTIDLGFAWMELPGGEEIGFIDVPGHRDFIDNMLAGVGGIDAALFVVAADEGVMPQTVEHMAILDLLELEQAIVVLTKIDLIEDEDWLDLVEEEIRERLLGTSLEKARFSRVSAITGEGIERLKTQITDIVLESESRPDLSQPRLSVDRVFTISGFGTVVTGTLLDGTFQVGQEVEILPNNLKGRIRGLQTHKKKVSQVKPGSRTAMNLSGVDVGSIRRGDVVTYPGTYGTTTMVDVQYRHLNETNAVLKHNQQVKLFVGSSQSMARVRVLQKESVQPGEGGWLQLMLEDPIVVVRGDHYIIRRPSPGATLGGGRIADPHPRRRHRLKDKEVVINLEKMLEGTPGDILAQSLLKHGPSKLNEAIQIAGLSNDAAENAINELAETGAIIRLEAGEYHAQSDVLVCHKTTEEQFLSKIVEILTSFHQSQPMKFGMAKEELKSRSKIDGLIFPSFLAATIKQGHVVEKGTKVSLAEHEPQIGKDQQKQIGQLLTKFDNSPYSTPSVKDCISEVGEDIFQYLLESEVLVKVSVDVVFQRKIYEVMLERVKEQIKDKGTISVAEVRDLFSTSRKYALALMEHLDSINVTYRDGDVRRLIGD